MQLIHELYFVGLEDRAQKPHDEKTGRKRWRPEIDENERRASETERREHRCSKRKEGRRKEARRMGAIICNPCLPTYLLPLP